MSTLQDLIAQKDAIEREIKAAQEHSRTDAIAKVRALMAENGLTAKDLSGTARAAKQPAAVKFIDTETGSTWSGRGKRPNWLRAALTAGNTLESFAV